MSNEKPHDRTFVESEYKAEKTQSAAENERADEKKQTAHENSCSELFIRDWVMSSNLTPKQKLSVTDYINSKPGAWREYNGTDFKVVEAKVEGGFWKISFGVFLDDYEAQRMDVQIPLSE